MQAQKEWRRLEVDEESVGSTTRGKGDIFFGELGKVMERGVVRGMGNRRRRSREEKI